MPQRPTIDDVIGHRRWSTRLAGTRACATLGLAAATIFALLPGAPRAWAQEKLIAIDVLIEPGPTMLAEAAKWNARMREQIPQGFALDQHHRPHITLVQRYVRVSDLPQVLEAVARVRSRHKPGKLAMTATGLFHAVSDTVGLAGIVVEASPELLALQRDVIEAIDRYARTGGDVSAFAPDPAGTPFSMFMLEYVETFVPRQTGSAFNPHVTVGIAPLPWLEAIERQPFERFIFDASAIATYQLGNFGTAARRLDQGQPAQGVGAP